LYLVYCSLYGDIRLSRKAALHIAPAVFLSLALPFLQAGGLQDLISDHFQRRELDRFKILILVGIGSVLFYITYIFLHVRRFYLKSGIRGRSLAGAISAVVYFLLASAALVGLLVDASALTRSANAGATVLIVCLYLAQARYPEFLASWQRKFADGAASRISFAWTSKLSDQDCFTSWKQKKPIATRT
jgi:hypothetical protein